MLFLYVQLFVICFIVILAAVKFGAGIFYKILGASFYTFNAGKRIKIVSIISAIAALVLTIVIQFVIF